MCRRGARLTAANAVEDRAHIFELQHIPINLGFQKDDLSRVYLLVALVGGLATSQWLGLEHKHIVLLGYDQRPTLPT